MVTSTISSGFQIDGTSLTNTGNLLAAALHVAGNSFNCTAQNLSRTRAALARVRANAGNGNILYIGDSTCYGSWAGPAGIDTGNLQPYNSTARLTDLFNEVFASNVWNASANSNAFMGMGNSIAENRSTTDGRVTFGANWSILSLASNAYTLGGGIAALQNQNTSNTLSFLPTVAVDTFKVFYAKNTNGAVFSVNIDGGAATNTNSNAGSSGFGSVTIVAGSVGTHTLNVNYVSGASDSVFIIGVIAYNSTIPTLNVVNASVPGGTTANAIYNGFGYSPLPLLAAIGQDLTIIELGLNDLGASVAAATYQSNLQTLITAAQAANSDVVLVTPNVNSLYSTASYQAYIAALYALASSNNVPLIDTSARNVSFANAAALGFMSAGAGGNQHPSAMGQADKALAIFNSIGSP